MKFGEMLKKQREKKGISGYTIAKKLEVTPPFYYSIERGYKMPLKNIPIIRDILSFSNDEFKNLVNTYIKEFYPELYDIMQNLEERREKTKIKIKTKRNMARA